MKPKGNSIHFLQNSSIINVPIAIGTLTVVTNPGQIECQGLSYAYNYPTTLIDTALTTYKNCMVSTTTRSGDWDHIVYAHEYTHMKLYLCKLPTE